MGLDLTSPGCSNPSPHYRRYLGNDGHITIVCVQDFDYHDYDTGRFVDSETFNTEAEAQMTPIHLAPLFAVIETGHDPEAAEQASRAVGAILAVQGIPA